MLVAAGGSQRAPPAPAREGRRDAPGRAGGGGAVRPGSPSPSVVSEGRDEPERQLDEERERRIRLQLYVFVVRCIAYPFNAKQPTDMARRQQKVGAPRRPRRPRRDVAGRGEQWSRRRGGRGGAGGGDRALGKGTRGLERSAARRGLPGSAGTRAWRAPLRGPGALGVTGSLRRPQRPGPPAGRPHSPAARGCAQLRARPPGRALPGRGRRVERAERRGAAPRAPELAATAGPAGGEQARGPGASSALRGVGGSPSGVA